MPGAVATTRRQLRMALRFRSVEMTKGEMSDGANIHRIIIRCAASNYEAVSLSAC